MHDRPAELHIAIAVLAPPRRFELLLLMLTGVERNVSQLADAVGLSQSCTTRHLQALARAGLIRGVRDGKRVLFRIAPRDDAARAVLASVTGARPQEPRARREPPPPPPPPQARARRRRRAPVNSAKRGVLAAAIRIESAAEFEPLMAVEMPADPVQWTDSPSVPHPAAPSHPSEDSELETPPAWRRSEIEDFLL